MFHMTVLLCEFEDLNYCFLVEACPERTQTFFAFLCIWISHCLSHFRPRIAHRFNWIVPCKRSLMDSLFFCQHKIQLQIRPSLLSLPQGQGRLWYTPCLYLQHGRWKVHSTWPSPLCVFLSFSWSAFGDVFSEIPECLTCLSMWNSWSDALCSVTMPESADALTKLTKAKGT